jgi:hypothetical protein
MTTSGGVWMCRMIMWSKAEGLKPAETTISVEATPLYIH